jgi:thymidylate kinase
MINLLEKSKYPIFVFEGPDGAGKTTLALELQKYVGARYLHLTYRFRDKMDLYHYAAIRLAAHLAQHQPVVVDRWWISEILYAEAYRGGSPFIKRHFLLEHIATKIGVVYVACVPGDRDQYLDNYRGLRETRTTAELKRDPLEGVEKVYDLYVDFFKTYLELKENVCHYDMFQNFNTNEVSRGLIMRNICQNVLEMTEDYRRTI